MKKIVIRCWFVDSENFIKDVIKGFNIEYSKIFDYRQAIGLLVMREDWILTGDETVIDSFIESIENTDYDIEILDEVDVYKG